MPPPIIRMRPPLPTPSAGPVPAAHVVSGTLERLLHELPGLTQQSRHRPSESRNLLEQCLLKIQSRATDSGQLSATPESAPEARQRLPNIPESATTLWQPFHVTPIPPYEQRQRRFPRRPGAGTVNVCLKEALRGFVPQQIDRFLENADWNGRLCDLSLQGAAFSLNHELSTGTELILRIWNPAARRRVDTSAQVVWTKRAGIQLWIVGCELLQPLEREQLQDAAQQQQHVPGTSGQS